MSEVQEYAARLARVIGPRPAGTEEEQQAALFLDEVFHDQAGLSVETEEFNCNPNYELPRIICCIVSVVLALLALFLPLMVIPAFIVCAIMAALFALEVFGKGILTRTAKRGVSQNVVAKYEPAASNTSGGRQTRSRKIILLARYDSGRVRKELNGALFSVLPTIQWIEIGGMVLVPVVLLVRWLTGAADGLLIVLDVLMVVGVVASLLPIIGYLVHQAAPYNDGANCNAAGTAVLAEVARRVGRGLYDHGRDNVVMHGPEEAVEQGAAPEGAELAYGELEAAGTGELDPEDVINAAEAELANTPIDSELPPTISMAEAAAAEATPQMAEAMAEAVQAAPVSSVSDMQAAFAQSATALQAQASAPAQESAYAATQAAFASSPAVQQPTSFSQPQQDNVPDWFRRGREKANKTADEGLPAQRSRFADALDAAAAASRPAEPVQQTPTDVELRLQQMRASIMGATPAATAAQAAPAATPEKVQVIQADDMPETNAPAGIDGFLSNNTSSPAYQAQPEQGASVPAAGNADALAASEEAAAKKHDEAEQAAKETRKRRAISLPSLTGSLDPVKADDSAETTAEPAVASTENTRSSGRQNAPLGDMAEGIEPELKSDPRAKRGASLASSLPALDTKGNASSSADKRSSRNRAAVRDASDPDSTIAISQVGSFASGGMTGAFAPIGEELVAGASAEEIYVEDADDSGYDGQVTAAGAIAGPGYVDMPQSRMSRMFGKFRGGKKKRDDDVSFAESIGVDEDFDARRVGKERGGWESFRDESADAWDDDSEWSGGSYSRDRSRDRNPFGDLPLSGRTRGEEREAIQDFHNGPINMEIWFVGLGAELADNAGIKDFLAKHGQDLRGSMVIDLDALGAGELSMIEEEGRFKPVKMASRLKRYVHKASSALGMSVSSGKMLWRDTAAYYTTKHGLQTLHLAGMEGGKFAYLGEADDVFDNLDMEKLEENTDFVMELIRSI